MPDALLEIAGVLFPRRDDRVSGVAIGQVVQDVDPLGEARVQVRLPWVPGFEPWARVCTPGAAGGRGLFWQPQIGDEVLLAFCQGDIREPYVLGGLWNGVDRPPTLSPADALTKVVLKTNAGHVIELDDLAQSVSVTTTTEQKITLDPQKIELTAGSAKVTLETQGSVTIEAPVELTVKAGSITIQGTDVDIQASASASIDGGGTCAVRAGLVTIN
jgi:phage baseplate assembly protein V